MDWGGCRRQSDIYEGNKALNTQLIAGAVGARDSQIISRLRNRTDMNRNNIRIENSI